MPLLRRPRSTGVLFLGALLSIVFLYTVVANRWTLQNTLSYATRPIWDKSDGPTKILPHFYGEGMAIDEKTCSLHGWESRRRLERVKVLDAVLMSTELDLLEIRMNELDSVVDHFLIVESNATFTGRPKETFFKNNRQRFAKFDSKIVYHLLPGYTLQTGQTPWDVEAHTRNTMSALIRHQIASFSSDVTTMVIMADLDEIPASHTVDLLKRCDFGSVIHLQLKDYLYSYEWLIGLSSWRASAIIWNPESFYRHSMATDVALADAGWHCSYCFRTIGEYAVKMQGFSHADRIAGRLNLLEPKRIQDTICKGKDIFGMLPEAYTFLDLWQKMSLKPLKSAVGLPRYLVENGEKFRFLLPGGCIRES